VSVLRDRNMPEALWSDHAVHAFGESVLVMLFS
jgi:hypothetical protein